MTQRLSDIATLWLAWQTRPYPQIIDFKISPFVIGLEQMMRIRSAFDLRYFYDRLITHALIGVGIVHWVTRPINQLEHLPI